MLGRRGLRTFRWQGDIDQGEDGNCGIVRREMEGLLRSRLGGIRKDVSAEGDCERHLSVKSRLCRRLQRMTLLIHLRILRLI